MMIHRKTTNCKVYSKAGRGKTLIKKPIHSEKKSGRWEKWEQIAFLKGLRKHGKGKWKLIRSKIKTR
jgi:ketosteroid isomerase-like protein